MISMEEGETPLLHHEGNSLPPLALVQVQIDCWRRQRSSIMQGGEGSLLWTLCRHWRATSLENRFGRPGLGLARLCTRLGQLSSTLEVWCQRQVSHVFIIFGGPSG
eukprot:Gb_21417 [translate_table: standard]